MWDYYPKVTKRIEIIADYLKDKVENKVIIDLNCGKSPILDYLSGFKAYFGNDILIEDSCSFKLNSLIGRLDYSDEDFTKELLTNNVPANGIILLVLGHGGYPKHTNKHESSTINDSVNKIIAHLKPKIVVIESVEDFTQVIDENIDLSGYIEKLNKYLDLGSDWVEKRRIRIYERNSSLTSNL